MVIKKKVRTAIYPPISQKNGLYVHMSCLKRPKNAMGSSLGLPHDPCDALSVFFNRFPYYGYQNPQ